jgi:hypothetical protein
MSSSHEEVTDGVYTPDPPSVPIKIMPKLVKKRYKCVTNRDAMGSGAAFSGGKGGTADVHSGRKRRTSLRTQGFLHGRSGRQPVAMPSCATSTNTSFPKAKHPKSPSPPSCENSSSTSTHNSKSTPLNSRHVKTVATADILSRPATCLRSVGAAVPSRPPHKAHETFARLRRTKGSAPSASKPSAAT